MKPKVYLSDLMSEKDKQTMRNREIRIEKEKASYTTQEWLSLCELGIYYGWPSVQDVMTDKISISQMNQFLKGGRKIHASWIYDIAIAVAAGYRGKDKNNSFETLLAPYIKDMKEVN